MYRRRRIVAVAGVLVIALMLGVGSFAMGRSSAAVKPTETMVGPPVSGVGTGSTTECSVVQHSPEGAATTAASGLYELALANMGSPAASPERAQTVEKILARYVVAEQRSVMRQYLETSQSTLTDILEMPMAYQVVSYGEPGDPAGAPDASTAVIRLLVVDYGRAADGTPKSSSGVIDATLHWDPTQDFWRLASWPGNDDPAALTGLLQNVKGFCHAALSG